jgi:hypothetical protein
MENIEAGVIDFYSRWGNDEMELFAEAEIDAMCLPAGYISSTQITYGAAVIDRTETILEFEMKNNIKKGNIRVDIIIFDTAERKQNFEDGKVLIWREASQIYSREFNQLQIN